MSTKVLRGDVRQSPHGDWIILRTMRGYAGEARTMVVIGRETDDGVAYAFETRTYATVAAWPRIGRMRVSRRDDGGHYVAPWYGALPTRYASP